MLICSVGLFMLVIVAGTQAADITWDEAKAMLQSGQGIPNNTAKSLPLLGAPAENPDDYGAESNPTGDPIGGCLGYRDIKVSGNFTVGTREQLLSALKQAKAGQVVYVKPDAQIDLTGHMQINVPAGVTLAGNRGEEGGDSKNG